MLAITNGHTLEATQLIKAGADVNHRCHEGFTTIELAKRSGNDCIVRELIDAGAYDYDEDNKYVTDLMRASMDGDLTLVEKLIEDGADVNQTTKSGDTALMMAVDYGYTSVVAILIAAGAKVSLTNIDQGRSPLMQASIFGYDVIARHLIDPDGIYFTKQVSEDQRQGGLISFSYTDYVQKAVRSLIENVYTKFRI